MQHLACCPMQKHLFSRFLQITPVPAEQALVEFLLLGSGDRTLPGQRLLCKRALGIYALYRCHNQLRSRGWRHSDLDGAFGEFLREGQRGTTAAIEVSG